MSRPNFGEALRYKICDNRTFTDHRYYGDFYSKEDSGTSHLKETLFLVRQPSIYSNWEGKNWVWLLPLRAGTVASVICATKRWRVLKVCLPLVCAVWCSFPVPGITSGWGLGSLCLDFCPVLLSIKPTIMEKNSLERYGYMAV